MDHSVAASQDENTNMNPQQQQPSLPIPHLPTLLTESTGAGSPFVLFPTSGSNVPQLYVLQQGEVPSHLLYLSGSQGGVSYPPQFAVAVNAPMVNQQTTSTNFGNGKQF